MAVLVDVTTGPGGPEPALAVPGTASEGRSLGQTGGNDAHPFEATDGDGGDP